MLEIAPHYKPRATRSATYKQVLSGPSPYLGSRKCCATDIYGRYIYMYIQIVCIYVYIYIRSHLGSRCYFDYTGIKPDEKAAAVYQE